MQFSQPFQNILTYFFFFLYTKSISDSRCSATRSTSIIFVFKVHWNVLSACSRFCQFWILCSRQRGFPSYSTPMLCAHCPFSTTSASSLLVPNAAYLMSFEIAAFTSISFPFWTLPVRHLICCVTWVSQISFVIFGLELDCSPIDSQALKWPLFDGLLKHNLLLTLQLMSCVEPSLILTALPSTLLVRHRTLIKFSHVVTEEFLFVLVPISRKVMTWQGF